MIFQIDFKFEGLCAATFAPMKENGYVLCGIVYLLKPRPCKFFLEHWLSERSTNHQCLAVYSDWLKNGNPVLPKNMA